MQYYQEMKHLKELLDPFVLTALIVLGVCAFTYVNLFLEREFLIFTTEEEIEASIAEEFPLFVDYL